MSASSRSDGQSGGILGNMSALTDTNPEVRRIRFFQLWVPLGCAIIGLPVLYLRGWDSSSPWQAVTLPLLVTLSVIVPASLITAMILTFRRSHRLSKAEQARGDNGLN